MNYEASDAEVTILLDQKLYPMEAIYTTCYVFLDKYYLYLDKTNGKIKVSLKPKAGVKSNSETFRGEFMNELMNNTLRVTISKRNQKMRDYIVKTALFFSQPKAEIDNSFLGMENEQSQDWQKDPLGITMPWEEKYEKKKKKTR